MFAHDDEEWERWCQVVLCRCINLVISDPMPGLKQPLRVRGWMNLQRYFLGNFFWIFQQDGISSSVLWCSWRDYNVSCTKAFGWVRGGYGKSTRRQGKSRRCKNKHYTLRPSQIRQRHILTNDLRIIKSSQWLSDLLSIRRIVQPPKAMTCTATLTGREGGGRYLVMGRRHHVTLVTCNTC